MSYNVPVQLNIGQLADRAELSRRAVRFYVQQGLLPPPHGLGRGSFYDESHLKRLRRIIELQQLGHSLDAIRRIIESPDSGESEPSSPPAAPSARPRRPTLSAQLWTRVAVGEGIELHFDNARHQPTVEQLMAARAAIRIAFGIDSGTE